MISGLLRNLIAAVVSIAALLSYALIHIYAVVMAFLAHAPGELDPRLSTPEFEFIATSLAGLVGGIVAAGLGVPLNDPAPDIRGGSRRLANMGRLLGLSTSTGITPSDWRVGVIGAYVIIYLLVTAVGLIALVVSNAGVAPLTKTQAFVGLGVGVALVNAYLVSAADRSGSA
jgi:hypothetical protein